MKFGNLFEYAKCENNVYRDVNYEGVYYESVIHDKDRKIFKFYVSCGDSAPDITMRDYEPYIILESISPRENLCEAIKIYLRQEQGDQTPETLAKMAAYLTDIVEETLGDFE